MPCDRSRIWDAPARLVNRAWGFEAEWVPLHLALEQFRAHAGDLQDGMALDWRRSRTGAPTRLSPEQVRSLVDRSRGDLGGLAGRTLDHR